MIITLINDKDKWQLTEAVPEELIRSCNVVICALEGEDLKGVLLARAVRKETWDITYLFVAEEARGAGVARDMLKLLILTAQGLGVGTLTLSFVSEGGNDDLAEQIDQTLGGKVFVLHPLDIQRVIIKEGA